MSKIEWTQETWNPVVGCTKVSAGCTHCYAERMAKRLAAIAQAKTYKGLAVPETIDRYQDVIHPHFGTWNDTTRYTPAMLDIPRNNPHPTTYFVCSMGDLFHGSVKDSVIYAVLDTMRACPWHQFLVLTKRAGRIRNILKKWKAEQDAAPGDMLRLHLTSLDHIYFGVTAEDQETYEERYLNLTQLPVQTFVSMEPLLGPIHMGRYNETPDAVIVGGETGPGARPMHPGWILPIRSYCETARIPFFFKQWGDNLDPYAQRMGANPVLPHGGSFFEDRTHQSTPWNT